MRHRHLLLAVVAFLVAPNLVVLAQEEPEQPVVQEELGPDETPEERANLLARQAVRAARANDPETAVQLLRRAAALVPHETLYRYDLGVALEQFGTTDEARTAYDEALAGVAADGPAGRSALFNRANIELRDGLSFAERVADPDAVALEIARLGGGQSPDPAITKTVQRKLIEKGLASLNEAIPRYRDLVRRSPEDEPVAHNLEIAQRTRRALENALEELEDPPRDDKGDESENDDDPNEEGGESEDSNTSGADGTDENDTGDEGDEGEDQPSDGEQPADNPNESETEDESDGESGESSSTGGTETKTGEGGEVSDRQVAEDRLAELMEAARRKLERVRAGRRDRLRRGAVERDW